MASFDSLKDLIRSVIYENEDQAITGEVMQNTLLEMVRSLGTGYKYIGIADADTDPGTPDENVFYFATAAGTYTHFGNLTVAANEIAILKGSGSSWSKDVTSIASTGALQVLNEALEHIGQQIAPASLTYAELKTLRDAGELIPGKIYRITDYVTTTIDPESRSAGHVFDLLVIATDANHLSEDAGACLHDGDTYFSNTNFSAWKIRYCLDNDITRFTWADTTNGKGVIYRMIDEWLNDVPYDFKNIQFKRYKVTAKAEYADVLSILDDLYIGLPNSYSKGMDIDTSDFKWFYTFSRVGSAWADDVLDDSLLGTYAANNDFRATTYHNGASLNNLVFANGNVIQTWLTSLGQQTGELLSNVNSHCGENISQITSFGGFVNMFCESQFRQNIIVGLIRHCQFGSDFQNNTIVSVRDHSFCSYAPAFSRNIICSMQEYTNNRWGEGAAGNVIKHTKQFQVNEIGNWFKNNTFTLTGNSNYNCFLGSFHDNTLYGSISQSFFTAICDVNTFGTQQTPVYLEAVAFLGARVRNNIINATITNLQVLGQFAYNELYGRIAFCTCFSYLTYVVIPADSTNYFAACDIKGNIVGSSSAKITLGASEFRAGAANSCRRVIIETDTAGAIVATWRGADGHETGIRSADKGATWAALT